MPCDQQKVEQVAQIHAEWVKNLDADTRAKRDTQLACWKHMPATMKDFFDEMFNGADADGDNRLNREEFVNYNRTATAEGITRFDRVAIDYDEERVVLEYDCLNSVNQDEEGISKGEYFQGF